MQMMILYPLVLLLLAPMKCWSTMKVIHEGTVGIRFAWDVVVEPVLSPGSYFFNPVAEYIAEIYLGLRKKKIRRLTCRADFIRGGTMVFENIDFFYQVDNMTMLKAAENVGSSFDGNMQENFVRNELEVLCSQMDLRGIQNHVFNQLLFERLQLGKASENSGVNVTSISSGKISYNPNLNTEIKVTTFIRRSEFKQFNPTQISSANSSATPDTSNNCENQPIGYIPEKSVDVNLAPVMLVGLSDLGNAYFRRLIELSTNIYSGSIRGPDPYFGRLFPGENSCGIRTSIVDAPSNNIMLNQNLKIQIVGKYERRKCAKGLAFNWNRVITLVQDPYELIYSNFLHKIAAIRSSAVETDWMKFWANEAHKVATEWNDNLFHLSNREKFSGSHVTIRLENLLNESSRHAELTKALNLFGIKSVSEAKLNCTFREAEELATSLRLHRPDRIVGPAHIQHLRGHYSHHHQQRQHQFHQQHQHLNAQLWQLGRDELGSNSDNNNDNDHDINYGTTFNISSAYSNGVACQVWGFVNQYASNMSYHVWGSDSKLCDL